MSDTTQPELVFIRIRSRRAPDVLTYQAVPRTQLDDRLGQVDGDTITESCEVVLPPISLDQLAADVAALPDSSAFTGAVTGGVWITGPLAGRPAPRGPEWYR
ncbi:MAG: hypothetical protein ACRDPY_30930 [Streptosporangiaceae bacterium]